MNYQSLRPLSLLLLVVVALALIALCTLPAHAGYGSCGVVYPTYNYAPTYYTPTYQDNYVQKKTVVLEYQLVPLFAVGYAGQYQQAPPPAVTAPGTTPCEEAAKKLQARLDALELKLGGSPPAPAFAPKKEEAPPPMQPVPEPAREGTAFAAKTVIGTTCARCHDADVAAAAGKGVVLSQGGRYVAYTPELLGRMVKYVSSGKCPKGKPLSPEDFSVFFQEIADVGSK